MSKELRKDVFTSFNYCFLLLDLEIQVLVLTGGERERERGTSRISEMTFRLL